jgi:hypothetical protein
MMGDMFNASGSNGGAGMAAMQKLMQSKMIEEMFGMKVGAEPLEIAGEMIGQDPNGSFGVLGIRLMPATMAMPVPILSLETNGRLSIRPKDLETASAFFQRIKKPLGEKYDEAKEDAKKLEGYELFAAFLGTET